MSDPESSRGRAGRRRVAEAVTSATPKGCCCDSGDPRLQCWECFRDDHELCSRPKYNASEGATVRCKRCGGSPVVAEVEGRTLVCATCRDDAEFRSHAERDYR